VKDDRPYLEHILECINRITEYTHEGKKFFLTDKKTQDAVLRNLQTLAESARRLSERLKAQRLEVDWRALTAFRNVVVHDYLGIDLEQVWQIIEHDLPDLKPKVERMVRDLASRE